MVNLIWIFASVIRRDLWINLGWDIRARRYEGKIISIEEENIVEKCWKEKEKESGRICMEKIE